MISVAEYEKLKEAGFPFREIKAGDHVPGPSLDIDNVHYFIPSKREFFEAYITLSMINKEK